MATHRWMGESVEIQPTSKFMPISASELNNAELEILKHVQHQCFKQERERLKQADRQTSASRQNALKNFKLDPTLTQDLLRGTELSFHLTPDSLKCLDNPCSDYIYPKVIALWNIILPKKLSSFELPFFYSYSKLAKNHHLCFLCHNISSDKRVWG